MTRILIVDDEPSFVEMLTDVLTDEGYEVWSESSVDAAAALIRRKKPDLTIVDVRLEHPEGGWMILDLLRIDPETAHIPVIVCSGDTRFLQANADHLREEGCCILEKPFGLEDLLTLIDNALDPATPACSSRHGPIVVPR